MTWRRIWHCVNLVFYETENAAKSIEAGHVPVKAPNESSLRPREQPSLLLLHLLDLSILLGKQLIQL